MNALADKLPKVYGMPAGVPLAKVLAECLWREYKDDMLGLSDVEIYLPNRRSCRSLADAFLEVSDGQATILPRLTPLGDIEDDDLLETDPFILDEDPFLQPAISPFERQILLTQMILKRGDLNLSVTEAFSLAAEFAALIDKAHTENVDLKKIDTLVPADLAAHWQVTVDFLKIVMEAWPNVLAEMGKVDPAYRRNLLLAKKADALRRNPPQHRVIAAGSTGSIPASAALMDVIARLPNGCVVLPCFDPDIDPKTWDAIDVQHPYYFQKRLLERFAIEPKQVKQYPQIDAAYLNKLRAEKEELLHHALQPKEIFDLSSIKLNDDCLHKLEFIPADHPNHEARIVSLLLREVLNHPQETAIVVTSDRDLAQKIRLEMKRWDIDIDDSAGYKLNQTPVGIYLRLLADCLSTTTPATQALSLLRNPFTDLKRSADQREAEIAALEAELRTQPLPMGGLHTFARKNDIPILSEFLGIMETLYAEKSYTLHEWITHHLAAAETLAASADVPGADRLWIGDDGEAAADVLHGLLAVPSLPDIHLSCEDYGAFINTALKQVTLRPGKRLHPRLRILSPIEARMQQADLFVLAGVNEDVWPAKIPQDMWLSRPMRKSLGFNDPDVRIGQAALDFVMLFCAPRVVTTWSLQRDGAQAHASRWLQQIFAVLEKYGIDPTLRTSEYYHYARLWDQPTSLAPQQAPHPSPSISDRPVKISVTSVDKWNKDPYTIYAKDILKLYPQDDLDRALGPADWGTVIHAIIERFFNENAHKAPQPLQRFHAIAEEELRDYSLNPSQRMKWQSRLDKLGAWIVEDALQTPHDIVVEQTASVTLPLPDGRTFSLYGRADRLDRYKDGLTITDYKTGAIASRAKLKDGSAQQLPLLALAFQKENPTIRSLRYIQLSGTERKPATVAEFDNVGELIQANKEMLEDLLWRFYADGEAYAAEPLDAYDDYDHLKRVDEWALIDEEAEEGA